MMKYRYRRSPVYVELLLLMAAALFIMADSTPGAILVAVVWLTGDDDE